MASFLNFNDIFQLFYGKIKFVHCVIINQTLLYIRVDVN